MNSGYYGYVDYGNSSSQNTGNQIINCGVSDAYRYGIFIQNSDDVIIRNNEVSRPARTVVSTTADYYNIVVYDSKSTLIEKNHMHHPYGAASAQLLGHDARGVVIWSTNTAADKIQIINNLIEDFDNGFGSQTGIYCSNSTDNCDIWHNTIVFNSTANATSIYLKLGEYIPSVRTRVST